MGVSRGKSRESRNTDLFFLDMGDFGLPEIPQGEPDLLNLSTAQCLSVSVPVPVPVPVTARASERARE